MLAVVEPDYMDVFMTPSGILAYRQWVPNRVSLVASATKSVSLPWVSILGERHHRYGEGV